MKRQTQKHGVVTRWVPVELDVNPFRMLEPFHLQRSGSLNIMGKICDRLTVGTHSLLVRKTILGRTVSQFRMDYSSFRGIALRLSSLHFPEDGFAVSVNLHHDLEEHCYPLFFAFDMDVAGARLQTWSRSLGLPILLPALNGAWQEPSERLGRLAIKTPVSRHPRTYLATRKPLMPAFRETCTIDHGKVVSGREIIAWD